MVHFVFHLLGQFGLLLAVLAAAYGFGVMIVRLLGLWCSNGLERWLFALGLGLGCLSAVVLGLGALALYYPVVAAGLVVLGLLFAIWDTLRRRSLAWSEERSKPSLKLWFETGLSAGLTTLRQHARADWAVALLMGLIGLLALSYALFANALTPPVSYDAVAYHLAIPKIYQEAHRLVYIPYIVYSNWPLGTEMLFTLGLLLGSEFLPQLITWTFAVIIGLGLVSFARGRLLSWTGPLAAVIFFTIPMVATLTGTALIEVPLACYTTLAFYALWRWHETERYNWLITSALLSGCVASAKLNGAGVAIVLALVALVLALVARRPLRGLQAFAVYGIVSFLVVAPWYLRTWIMTGDPIWPFLQPVFEGRDWDALGTEYLLGYIRTTNLPLTFKNWLLGPWYMTTDGLRFGSFLLGPYLLLLLPFAALAAFFERRHRLLLGVLGLTCLGFYSIWFLLTHQTRFLMPIVPLLALLAAEGVAWVWQIRWPSALAPVHRLLQAALLLWLLVGAWIFNPHRRAEWALGWAYLRGEADRDTYLTQMYEDYPAFAFANETLPGDAVVLLAPYEARGYYLDRPYVWANPIGQRFLQMEKFSDIAAFRDELRELGVTHILMNTRVMITNLRHWPHLADLFEEMVASHGTLLFESAQSQLFALHLEEPVATPGP